MKKFLYTLLFTAILIACEDNFEQFYKGGIPSKSEFRIWIDNFNWDSSGSDGKYNYGIHQNNYYAPQSIQINMPYISSTFSGRIEASVDWEFTNVPEWLTISPSSGTGVIETSYYQEPVRVTFTLSEHSYITPRFATVYLEGSKDGWKMVDTLRFSQYGIAPTLVGIEESITLQAKADTAHIYLNSNCDFNIECSNDYWNDESATADWFKAEVVKSDSTGFTHKIIVTSDDYTRKSSSSYYDSYRGYLKFYISYPESNKKEYIDYKIEVFKQSPAIDFTPEISDDYANSVTKQLSSKSQKISVLVNANYDFEIISDKDWFTVSATPINIDRYSHKIDIEISDFSYKGFDNRYDFRNGTIKFYDPKDLNSEEREVFGTIHINQLKPAITQYSADSEWYPYHEISIPTFPVMASTHTAYITANCDFGVKYSDWISVDVKPIESEYHTHALIITANDYSPDDPQNLWLRNGEIEFTYFDKVYQKDTIFCSVSIGQESPDVLQYYKISDGGWHPKWDGYTFGPQSSTWTTYLASNYDFEIRYDDWISVSTEPINHEIYTHKMVVSVTDYPTSNSTWSSQEGRIQFIYDDIYNVRDMYITQGAPSANFNEYSLNFKGFASKDTVNVTANCKFTTSCSADWFYVDKIITNDSSYNAQIVLDVHEFPTATTTGSSRSGEIKLYYDADGSNIIKQLDYLHITQESHKITTPQTSYYTVKSNAQTLSFDIEADAAWTASTDVSWITLNSTSGERGKHTITLNIDELTSGTYSRYGNIHFMLYGNRKLTIEIYQVQTD